MQITISRKVLADALSDLATLAAKKQFVAILSNVKCVVKSGRMRMQTSDSQMTMRKYVELVSSDSEGEFLTDCTALNSFVGKVKDDTLTLTLADNILVVKHQKGCAKFPALTTELFPEISTTEKNTEIEIPSAAFGRLVGIARKFVANYDYRPIMKNVHVKIDGGYITVSATDTHQLFTDKVSVNTGELSTEWVVEQYALAALVKAYKNTGKITVRIDEKNIQYRLGATTIFTQCSVGRFPTIERAIPKTHEIELTCDKSELADAVSRAMMFTEQTGIIKVKVSQMTLDLSVNNIENLRSANESVACSANGEMTLGVNAAYFANCIDACAAKDVLVELSDPSRPIVIKDKDNPDRVVLCMPMQIV